MPPFIQYLLLIDYWNYCDKIKKIADNNNGIVYAKDLEKQKIHRQFIAELEKKGYLTRIMKGIYVRNDVDLSEFWVLSKRYKNGIFSHNTALYFYNMTDRTPLKIDLTFPSNNRIHNEFLKIHYVKKENHKIGAANIKLEDGTELNIYNIERTICDIIRDRNKIDPQILNKALNEYVKRKDKNLPLLYEYAKIFRIDKILIQYMEVLQ